MNLTPNEKAALDFDTEVLLDMIDEERLPGRKDGKYREPDMAKMKQMIDTLIERGVYPAETVDANPNNVYSMVSGYGARWFEWNGTLTCGHCGADLRDHRLGPPYKREMGHYNRGTDRTEWFECPDCKNNIHSAVRTDS
jgi:hypothetical protein